MAATVAERAYTGPFGSNTATREYVIIFPANDTPTDALALAALQATAPDTFLGLLRSETEIKPEPGNDHLYFGSVKYSLFEYDSSTLYADTIQGSTRGSRQTITQSYYTTKYPALTAPDEGGAIGYDGTTVKGVEIDIPSAQWSKTKRVANLSTDAFFNLCMITTGCVNDSTFLGNPAGTVKFLGADFQKADNDYSYFVLNYAYSANQTGLTIGDITGIDKEGWDVLDVRYEDVVDDTSKTILRKPKFVYVHRVYPRATLPS